MRDMELTPQWYCKDGLEPGERAFADICGSSYSLRIKRMAAETSVRALPHTLKATRPQS